MLRNPQDCEDALQEGLLLAFRNLNQFQGRSKFSTWLHSIVRNAARTHVRKRNAGRSVRGRSSPMDESRRWNGLPWTQDPLPTKSARYENGLTFCSKSRKSCRQNITR